MRNRIVPDDRQPVWLSTWTRLVYQCESISHHNRCLSWTNSSRKAVMVNPYHNRKHLFCCWSNSYFRIVIGWKHHSILLKQELCQYSRVLRKHWYHQYLNHWRVPLKQPYPLKQPISRVSVLNRYHQLITEKAWKIQRCCRRVTSGSSTTLVTCSFGCIQHCRFLRLCMVLMGICNQYACWSNRFVHVFMYICIHVWAEIHDTLCGMSLPINQHLCSFACSCEVQTWVY